MEHPKIDMKFNPILNRFTPIKERTKKIIKR
jgi:hypothetical protein